MEAETLVVFHRCGGRSLGYPPNTLFTAQWARDYGAKAIEYDIVLCKDRSQYRIAVVEPKLLKAGGSDNKDLEWGNYYVRVEAYADDQFLGFGDGGMSLK